MSGPDRDRRRHRLLAARPDPLPRGDERRQGPPRRRRRGGHHRRPQRDHRRRDRRDRVLGLMLTGLAYMYGVALAASLAVLVVMLASITLLPALLSFLGPKVDRLRIPFLGRALKAEGNGESPAARWSHAVQRRPWTAAIAATAAAARAGGARARHAPRLPRRGQRPAGHDDPPGLRPEHGGLRARHERPAGDRRGPARPGRARRRSTPSRQQLRSEPGVAFVPAADHQRRRATRRSSRSSPTARPRTRRPRTWSTGCATTSCRRRSAARASPPRSVA